MKQVSAWEARRSWFRLLDEIAKGEVVVIRHKGRRIVLKREAPEPTRPPFVPDYSKVLVVPRPEEADRWRWAWDDKRLISVDLGPQAR